MPENRYQGYRYHLTNHQSALGNMAYMAADLAVWGVIAGARLMAGHTRQESGVTDGSIAFGGRKAKEADMIAWIGSRGPTRKAAGEIWAGVKRTGCVTVTPAGYVRIANWPEEQEMPSTPNTQHKRDQRRRENAALVRAKLAPFAGQTLPEADLCHILSRTCHRHVQTISLALDQLVAQKELARNSAGELSISISLSNDASPPPSCPPPTTDYDSTTNPPDMSGTSPDMSADLESNRRVRITSTTSTRRPSTGGQDGGGELRAMLAEDPVEAACEVTHGFGEANRNIFGDKLREFKHRWNGEGCPRYCAIIEQLASELRAGEHTRFASERKLPRLLTSRFNKALKA